MWPFSSFLRRETEVLNHWISFADAFYTAPSEFYARLEKELADRNVPSLQISKVEFPEGGLLSEKRTYLRMVRERIVFDVCAASFGKGFFFSCRTSEVPIGVPLWQSLVMMGIILFVWYLLAQVFSFFLGSILAIALIGVGVYGLGNVPKLGIKELDQRLLESPVLGPIYEACFRKETYYRIDSRLCFIHTVPTAVKDLAEAATFAKGVKLVTQYELSPILGDLYRPSPPRRTDLSERQPVNPA